MSPGFIKTEMTDKLEKSLKDVDKQIRTGDLGTGEDVSNCVGTASEMANYINGETLCKWWNVYGLTF